MEELLKDATNNPWIVLLGIIGGALTIIGFPAMIIIYFKQKKEKLPSYRIVSNNVVRNLSSEISKVKVLFEDLEVQNLTITRIIFWNSGKEIMRGGNIATMDPITISSGDGVDILDIQIVDVKRSACGFGLQTIEEHIEYRLEFDFMDKWDAVVVQVVHNGVGSKDISFVGTIAGAKEIREIKDPENKRTMCVGASLMVASLAMYWVFALTGFLSIALSVFIFILLIAVLLTQFLFRNHNWLKSQERRKLQSEG